MDISPGQTINFLHNLGGTVEDYHLQLWFQDTSPVGLGIHTFGYGGFEEDGNDIGAYWQNLTSTGIQVVRRQYDFYVY